MVEPAVPAAPFYTLTPPLRIAAILSCLGIPAGGELARLRESVRGAGAGQVKLLVVASEEQLIVDLRKEMSKGVAPEIEAVEVMPADLSALQTLVSDFGPHLLHFYCHGSLESSAHIRLALKSDWTAANPTHGLVAEARDFHGFTRSTDDLPWLVVLNCCEGAGVDAKPNSQSLALSLALQGVAPAVVSMREPVVSDTANLLTKALYSKLIADIAARIDATGQAPQPLDWPNLVVAARDTLARLGGVVLLSQGADSTKEWTLPVVYVRPEPFNLQVAAAPQAPAAETGDIGGPQPGGGYIGAYRVEPPGWFPGERPDSSGGDDTSHRAARLEIEALQGLLAALPPNQAPELKAEATDRIAGLADELGVDLSAIGSLAAGPL